MPRKTKGQIDAKLPPSLAALVDFAKQSPNGPETDVQLVTLALQTCIPDPSDNFIPKEDGPSVYLNVKIDGTLWETVQKVHKDRQKRGMKLHGKGSITVEAIRRYLFKFRGQLELGDATDTGYSVDSPPTDFRAAVRETPRNPFKKSVSAGFFRVLKTGKVATTEEELFEIAVKLHPCDSEVESVERYLSLYDEALEGDK